LKSGTGEERQQVPQILSEWTHPILEQLSPW
jgi:hypothetical protein